jgi:hypothetical protein
MPQLSPDPQRRNQQHTCPRPPQTQLPTTHASLTAQALPQRPQWASLAMRLTHASPQRLWPSGQRQTPATQEAPLGHTVPQAPQWVALVWVLTQALPQSVWPLGQPQRPAVQV